MESMSLMGFLTRNLCKIQDCSGPSAMRRRTTSLCSAFSSAQGALPETASSITTGTGGYSFFQGTQTPVSFRPFLDDLQRMLAAQYLLTFRPAPVSTSEFHNLKVTTEASGVKLLAPNSVYVPASQ